MSALAVVPMQGGGIAAALSRSTYVEIHDHLGALLDTVDLCATPEQLAECQAEIAEYVEAELRKVDGICSYLAHCEAQAEAAGAEIERLEARKRSAAKRAERLSGYILQVMEALGKEKLEGRVSTLALRGCPASVRIVNEGELPAEYVRERVERAPDKVAIKQAIASGREVAGAVLLTGKKRLVRT